MSLSAVEIVPSQDETMSNPEPGLRRQVMSYSPGMMLVRHRMQKGWVGARHRHPHEQLVYIVSGHLSFQHPGGVFDAKAGDSFLVPGNVEHQASAVEDSEVLDIFTPYREDYATLV
jgi:quercetin dioxygenase-like cupin family protein